MSIQIAAEAMLINRHADHGLVGSVFHRDDDSKNRFITDIRLPMVNYGSSDTVQELQDLEPGRYLIQVSLPNNRVITQNFQIQAGEDTKVIIHIPHEGPHEWSTLHAMTGQFAAESVLTKQFTTSITPNPSSYDELRNDPKNGYSLALLRPEDGPAKAVFVPGQTNERLAELINQNLDVESAQQQLGEILDIDQPSMEDADFAIFRFGHSGLLKYEEPDHEHFDLGPGSDLSRHYLVQKSRQGAQLICLPTPWMTPDGQADVELLVKKYSVRDELDYAITMSDPMVNSALGYINMGAIHLAQRLIDSKSAQKMLFQKISFPMAATIGGYILVLGRNASQYRSESVNWKEWVNNLDNWFNWLPDGAILNSAMQLMDNAPDLEAARDALMRGYSRGLPYFTFGLKHMIDGMRFFASKDDDEAQQRLMVLETIASRADPGVPFLSVHFSNFW